MAFWSRWFKRPSPLMSDQDIALVKSALARRDVVEINGKDFRAQVGERGSVITTKRQLSDSEIEDFKRRWEQL